MITFKGKLEKLTWKQVRHEVAAVNPVFAKIIDDLSPGDNYWLAKATYPYGSMVMKRALLQLPNLQGDIVPITDLSIPTQIREGLNYNLDSNPVSIVLQNTFEIFLPLEDRTIPLGGLIYPGSVFGAWRILNPKNTQHPIFIWDMTAGARSVFMLPRITEVKKHLQLKRAYGLTVDTPRSLMHHWEIFRQLASHPQFKQPWHAEILYFSQSWFDHLEDSQWENFYNYFRDSGWAASELWSNQFMWNLVFSLILKDYEGKPNAYIMDTVQYLLNAGISAFPGLAPVQNTLGGPFDKIQQIYDAGAYGLRNYPPIIVQSKMFNMHNPTTYPVYYSLQYPNAPEFKPSSRVRTSLISDLHEIRSLLIRCEQDLLSDKFNLGATSLGNLFNLVEYDYFHNGVDLHIGMRDSAEIAKEDKRFLTTLDGKVHKNFPDTCSFVTGCIRISLKKQNN